MRSFRSILAFRVGLVALGLALALVLGGTLILRGRLISHLDASLVSAAELETDYGVEPGEGSPGFRFRSEALRRLPETRERYWAQLLSRDGILLARSPNLAAPLPIPGAAVAEARAGRIGFASHKGLRSAVYPMARAGPQHDVHLLQVSMPLGPSHRTLLLFMFVASGLGVAGAGLAGIGAYAVARRALTPALGLTGEVETIGVGELSRRVAVPEDLREFHRMALAFNSLLERVERAVKGTRRFTADASHELRAPLTVLRGELELALTRPRSGPEYEDVIRRCLDEVIRLSRLADDLLTLARVQGGAIGRPLQPVDLDDLVARAVDKERPLSTARRVSVEVSGTAGEVRGESELLLRAVDGLLEHAVMASPEGGRVWVRLASQDGKRSVILTDSGDGLQPDEVSGIFDRFYRRQRPRTRSAESGLGLAIARAVAAHHGGTLEFLGNDPGASFRMSLPAA